jgi:hypothetical protein
MIRIDFKERWGYSCNQLAAMEGVTPEAIRMRVRNFGTPFQRRKKPTKFETMYGKTLGEIAIELNLHPATVARRHNLYGNAYAESQWKRPTLRGAILNDRGEHWTENTKMGYCKVASTYMDQYDENNKT